MWPVTATAGQGASAFQPRVDGMADLTILPIGPERVARAAAAIAVAVASDAAPPLWATSAYEEDVVLSPRVADGFDGLYAVPRDVVAENVQNWEISVLEGIVPQWRLDQLDNEPATAAETRIWRKAWLRRAMEGEYEPGVLYAVSVIPLGSEEEQAVCIVLVSGYSAEGDEQQIFGYFASDSDGLDALGEWAYRSSDDLDQMPEFRGRDPMDSRLPPRNRR